MSDGAGTEETLVPAAGEPEPEPEPEAGGVPALNEKERKKAAKQEEKAAKQEEKAAAKAAKTAEKEKAKAEKQKAKEQKKLDKAAKKNAGTAGPVDTIASQPPWQDGVDDESTPEGGGLPSASVSPVDSPGSIWKGGAEAGQALAEHMSPVSAIRTCAVKRSDKKCIVLVDRAQNDGFLCCARLVQKAKKDKCWRFYMNPQAASCKPGDLTKDTRLGYFGKLEWSDPAVKPKTTLQLYDHGPGDGRTEKVEKLSMTMKKKKKHAQWKVRAPNVPGVIYRSQIPEWDKGRKRNVYPGMGLNPQESIKNFLLCKEDLASASTGSTAGVEIGDNAAAAKAAKDAAVRYPYDADPC
eukprot:COSAG02_NODE_1015_length_15191_cov_6.937450_11_plen_352_part_00